MKKRMWMLLSLLALLLALSVPVSAEESGGFVYEVRNGSAVILAYQGETLEDLVIPATLGGYPVTAIESHAFFRRADLTGTLTLPEGLTTIGSRAFAYCSGFEGDLILPSTLSKLESSAFEYCSGFDGRLVLSEKLTTIEPRAFGGCTGFSGELIFPAGLTTVGNAAFQECSSLECVLFPASLTALGDFAFTRCENLSRLCFEGDCPTWGRFVFSGARLPKLVYKPGTVGWTPNFWISPEGSMYQSVCFGQDQPISGTMGSSVSWELSMTGKLTIRGKGIASNAMPDFRFSLWEDITSVVVEEGVTVLPSGVFMNCWKIRSLSLPSTLSSMESPFGGGVTMNFALRRIDVAEGNEEFCSQDGILYSADMSELIFYPPQSPITDYRMPDTVKSMAYQALAFGAPNLCTLTIPAGFGYFDPHLLAEMTQLESVTVDPNNLTQMSEDGILYSRDRSELRFYPPRKKTESYTLPAEVTSISTAAFGSQNAYLKKLLIPAGGQVRVHSLAYVLGDLLALEEVEVDEENAFFASADGVLYDKTMKELVFYPPCKTDERYVLPATVTRLPTLVAAGDNGGNKYVKTIVLPSALDYLFAVNLDFFRALEEIVLDENETEYAVIDGVLFNKDKTELLIYPRGRSDAVYQVPDGTVSIAEEAFRNCANLKKVYTPDSLTHIGIYAFRNSGLAEVHLAEHVSYLGYGAFAECDELYDAYFYGDVPAYWNVTSVMRGGGYEDNVPLFGRGRHYDFLIHYLEEKEGWTTPTWTAPDEIVYNTEIFKLDSLKILGAPELMIVSDQNKTDPDCLNGIALGTTAKELTSQFASDRVRLLDKRGEAVADGDKIKTGDRVVLLGEDGKTILEEVAVVVKGDISGDGESDVLDVLSGLLLFQKDYMSFSERLSLDINEDGSYSTYDLIGLIDRLIGSDSTQPLN